MNILGRAEPSVPDLSGETVRSPQVSRRPQGASRDGETSRTLSSGRKNIELTMLLRGNKTVTNGYRDNSEFSNVRCLFVGFFHLDIYTLFNIYIFLRLWFLLSIAFFLFTSLFNDMFTSLLMVGRDTVSKFYSRIIFFIWLLVSWNISI